MSFIDKYFVRFFSKKIGEDKWGNKYYLGIKRDYLGRNKRYVIYNGMAETTKVPPMWHAWLHYMIEDIPDKIEEHKWQKGYVPNLSGTNYAYDPAESKAKKVNLYKAWRPKT